MATMPFVPFRAPSLEDKRLARPPSGRLLRGDLYHSLSLSLSLSLYIYIYIYICIYTHVYIPIERHHMCMYVYVICYMLCIYIYICSGRPRVLLVVVLWLSSSSSPVRGGGRVAGRRVSDWRSVITSLWVLLLLESLLSLSSCVYRL